MPHFIFDLDGTVTQAEILPRIAVALGLQEEIGLLTRLTLAGAIDFEQSFRLRFAILRQLPLVEVQAIVAATPLNPDILAFIADNKKYCSIATGNLDAWIEPLRDQIPCAFFCSSSSLTNGVLELESVLDKGRAVRHLKSGGQKCVAVGESYNDLAMFEAADISIAFGGVHQPVPALLERSDYFVPGPKELCDLLRSLQQDFL